MAIHEMSMGASRRSSISRVHWNSAMRGMATAQIPVNTMLMAILERTREIGMMVALGTTKSKVFLLVLFETILLTIAGTPLGLLAALVVTGYYHKHGLDLSGMGKDMMASFGFNTIVYPSFPIEKLLAIMLLVAGTAIVASLLPALKALRLEAVKALRR